MKKIICLLLIIVVSIPYAFAETDFSALSYDELRELQQKISAEIVKRPEWKEVTVPAGTWTIGKDIPSGAYSLKYTGSLMVTIETYENGTMVSYNFLSPTTDTVIGKIEFKDGQVITISGSLIFAPPISLGF